MTSVRAVDLCTALNPFETAVLLSAIPPGAQHDLSVVQSAGDGEGRIDLILRVDGDAPTRLALIWTAAALRAHVPNLFERFQRFRGRPRRVMAQLGRVLMRFAGPPDAWLAQLWGRPRLVLDGRAGCAHGVELVNLGLSPGGAMLQVTRWRRDAEDAPIPVDGDACRAADRAASEGRRRGLDGDLVGAAWSCRQAAHHMEDALRALVAADGPAIERTALAVEYVGNLLIGCDPAAAERAWATIDEHAASLDEATRGRLTGALRARFVREFRMHQARVTAMPAAGPAHDAWLDEKLAANQGDAAAWFARACALSDRGAHDEARRAAAMAAAYDGDPRFAALATDGESVPPFAERYARAHLPPRARHPVDLPSMYPLRSYAEDAGVGLVREAATSAPNFGLETDAIIRELTQWQARWGARVVAAGDDRVDVVFPTPPEPMEQFIDRLGDFCIDCFNFGVEPIVEGLRRGEPLQLWWD